MLTFILKDIYYEWVSTLMPFVCLIFFFLSFLVCLFLSFMYFLLSFVVVVFIVCLFYVLDINFIEPSFVEWVYFYSLIIFTVNYINPVGSVRNTYYHPGLCVLELLSYYKYIDRVGKKEEKKK